MTSELTADRDERARARAMDENDALAGWRDAFVIDDPDLIYADGNSLGRLPKRAAARAREMVEHEWGVRLIRGWGEGWMRSPERVGDKIAQLIGARPDEVVVADSTTVNLIKLAIAALRARPGRTKILTDDLNFPSDLYALEQTASLLGAGHRIETVASPDGIHGPVDGLVDRIDGDTALVALSHTVFKSGYTYDLGAVTAAAHEAGALVLWDLSHSVGSIPVDLGTTEVDLAVGCTYKYLNGGPGSPAFLFVRGDLQADLENPLVGWMGHRDRFGFSLEYEPAGGMAQFLTGTPSALALALVEVGVEMVLEAGMPAIRAKSEAQIGYLEELSLTMLAPHGFSLRSPTDPARRGSHLTLHHEHALGIDLALIHDLGVIPDFRAPDNLRLGIAGLYTRFEDVYELVRRVRTAVVDGHYRRHLGHVPEVS